MYISALVDRFAKHDATRWTYLRQGRLTNGFLKARKIVSRGFEGVWGVSPTVAERDVSGWSSQGAGKMWRRGFVPYMD